jgi:two-component system, cell cycle sensor histidine kinase and response regulator CckA
LLDPTQGIRAFEVVVALALKRKKKLFRLWMKTVLAAVLAALLWGGAGLVHSAAGQVPRNSTGSPSSNPPQSNSVLISLTAEERAWLRSHPVIRVVQDPGWPPVEFVNDRGEPSGISNDYLKLIEQRLDVKFKRVLNLSWQEAYARLKNRDLDMTTCVAVTPQRTEFWTFTKPYLKIPIVILTHADVPYIAGLGELAGTKVAVVDGYVAGEWIPRDFPNIRLVRVRTVREGLDLLEKREVFAFVDNMLVTGYYLTKLESANLKIAGESSYVNAQAMAVRKDWAVLAGILDKALDSISEEESTAIYRKWVPVRYEHGFNYSLFWRVLALFAVVLAGLVIWIRKLSRVIEARKRAEAALSDTETRYRLLFEQSPDGIVIIDPGTAQLLEFNDTACRQLGYSREEFARLSIPDIDAAETSKETKDRITKVMSEGRNDFETRHRTKQGEIRDIRVTAQFIEILGRRVYHCVWRDITERNRAEEEIRASERQLKSYIESAGDAIYVLEAETGRVRDCNERACLDLGHSKEELLKLSAPDIESRLTSDEVAMAHHDLSTGVVKTIDGVHKRKDGTLFPVEIRLSPLASTHSHLIIAVVRDITERKLAEKENAKLEAQLRQAQRMESVGRLAGGVAHDFNNMLGVILGHTELALNQLDPSQPLYDDLIEIQKAADRSANLTRQLLAFARKQTAAPRVLDLNLTIASMLNMLQKLIGEDINLNWHPIEKLWSVKIDPAQIDQILANLCVNARDAIPGIGKISIETENCTLDADYCAANKGAVPGEYVRLTVSDNGCGMDKGTLANIFEPFFTTKGIGKGTGLGLATIYDIVKQNNGYIKVYSEPGHGSTFSIYLARYVDNTEQAKGTEAVVQRAKHSHETILLVEDELSLLKSIKTMLESQGYTVLAASTPGEAIRLAKEHGSEIQLLMTDVVMPEMNGRDLAMNLLSFYPHLKQLFTSGYTADVITQQGVLADGVYFIQKPFTSQSLATKICEVLDKA